MKNLGQSISTNRCASGWQIESVLDRNFLDFGRDLCSVRTLRDRD